MANRHEHYQSNTRLITHDARNLVSTDQSPNEISSTEIPPRRRTRRGEKLFPKKEFPEFHPNSARPLCPKIFTWPSVIATWKSGPIGRGKEKKKESEELTARNRRLIIGDWRWIGDAIEKKEFREGGGDYGVTTESLVMKQRIPSLAGRTKWCVVTRATWGCHAAREKDDRKEDWKRNRNGKKQLEGIKGEREREELEEKSKKSIQAKGVKIRITLNWDTSLSEGYFKKGNWIPSWNTNYFSGIVFEKGGGWNAER